jgi:Tfp pilus assembly protein PilO
MALLPSDPRNRNLVLVTVLALALVVVYQQLVWSPKHTELVTLSARLDTLELGVLRRLVPTENEVPALLEGVSTAARRAGLELSDVQPDGVVNGDQFDTYKYKLGVTGPYQEIGEFLANVGSLPRIVAPINLTLSPTSRVGEMRPKKGEQFLDAKFGIQTYVAHAVVKPVPATSAKPGSP